MDKENIEQKIESELEFIKSGYYREILDEYNETLKHSVETENGLTDKQNYRLIKPIIKDFKAKMKSVKKLYKKKMRATKKAKKLEYRNDNPIWYKRLFRWFLNKLKGFFKGILKIFKRKKKADEQKK